MPVINLSAINLSEEDTFCQQQVILPSKGKAEQAVEREIISNIPLLLQFVFTSCYFPG